MWEPFRAPRSIRHPLFETGVKRLVRQERPPVEDVQRIAAQLHKHFVGTKKFHEAVQTFLDVCRSVDLAKNQVRGLDAAPYSAGMLLQFLACLMAEALPYSDTDFSVVEALAARLKIGGAADSWYYPKVHAVCNGMDAKRSTIEMARDCRLPAAVESMFKKLSETLGSPDGAITELMQALHEQRKYGIKPAYFQDGFFHRSFEAWIVHDPREILQAGAFSAHEMAAMMIRTERAALVKLGPNIHEEKGRGYSLVTKSFDYPCYASWVLDKDGELRAGGSIRMREIFAAEGNETAYMLARMTAVLRLFDLTVPLNVVERMTEPEPRPGFIRRLLGVGSEKPKKTIDPRLILRRLRTFVDDRENVVAEFEREREEDEERTRRRLGRHECVGHVRRLPPGREASPEAAALAAAEGLRLETGETYVRKHERGSGAGNDRVHRAVRRR